MIFAARRSGLRRVKKALIIIGTRPEAIKMAPVIAALRDSPKFDLRVAVTAQHRHLLDQVLSEFAIVPDHDLDLMLPSQSLDGLMARTLTGIGAVLDAERPDVVLVQGDTTTTFAAGLSAFYRKLPIAHIEAGLRSGSLSAPFPEEMNRRFVTLASRYHFAATEQARQNLLREGIPDAAIHVTGNTVIDALLLKAHELQSSSQLRAAAESHFGFLDSTRRLVLVTGHRRENFGDGLERICRALIKIAAMDGVEVVYTLHPNPNAREPVHRLLGGVLHVHLIEPVSYTPFVSLMQRAHLIITDSGGLQEEAPSLGKPVLVTRETTERPEALEAGTAILVGTSTERIVEAAHSLLTDAAQYRQMAESKNPYGDGKAAARIREVLER
jgi:UDP-N-acetylglucosamine 2-epimerase (non-hydrolysing)